MKRLFLFIAFIGILCATATAQVSFTFRGQVAGQVGNTLKASMNRNISILLTEIDNAGRADRPLNLSAVDIQPEAAQRLNDLWTTVHIVCDEKDIMQNCLNDIQGYQARNILVTVKPQDATYQGATQRELTVSLDRKGRITGMRLALESQESMAKIMGGGNAVTDYAERYEILKWVEDFRSYYNEKNIDALEQIYSDDELIITGSVVTKRDRCKTPLKICLYRRKFVPLWYESQAKRK